MDIATPDTASWWLARLMQKLSDRRAHFDMLEGYYLGTNVIPTNSARAVRQAYLRLMEMSRTNFAELIVEATRERMTPLGFRTGADSDENGDEEAWRIWQANSLDADHSLIERAALSMGSAYAIVGGPDIEIGAPLITPEDPRQVIAECDPARRRKVLAALKVYRDDVAGVDRALLYLPGEVWKASRPAAEVGMALITSDVSAWHWDDTTPEMLPAKVVPVVPFHNRPNLSAEPQAEYEPHLAILDRINYTILARLEAMTMQAFRQRAVKSNDLPTHDAEGEEIDYNDIFAADPGALWMLPATAELWESGVVDLTPILESVKADIRDLAGVTRTPMSYLFPDAASGSAEGAALMREGLVFKVGDRIKQFGESYEQVMSLAFTFADDPTRASRGDMELIWEAPERYTLSERASAAAQASTTLPFQTILRKIWQFTPQEIDRIVEERSTDVLMAQVAQTPSVVETPAAEPAAPANA